MTHNSVSFLFLDVCPAGCLSRRSTGLYVFMDGTDTRITATMTEDFLDLWHEDVFEVFLWTDEAYPVYFEYEISPLGYELPILIPNFGGEFLGWRPWHYEGERLTRRATTAIGGPREPGASITGWQAEVFIPWALLEPLQGVFADPGRVVGVEPADEDEAGFTAAGLHRADRRDVFVDALVADDAGGEHDDRRPVGLFD